MPDLPADADIGFDVQFQRATTHGDAASLTTIAQVIDITPPNLSRETVDQTHRQSKGRFREHLAALLDAGEASFAIQFSDVDDVNPLIRDMTTAAPNVYAVTFPSGGPWQFTGLVTGIELETPMDNRMEASVTIKLSGQPAFVDTAIA